MKAFDKRIHKIFEEKIYIKFVDLYDLVKVNKAGIPSSLVRLCVAGHITKLGAGWYQLNQYEKHTLTTHEKEHRGKAKKSNPDNIESSDFRNLLTYDESVCVGDCQPTIIEGRVYGITTTDTKRARLLQRGRTNFIENNRAERELY